MHHSIMHNAVESIQVGVEDFETGTRPRLVSSIRNIFAGLLLLYKHFLSEKSPEGTDEVLIKSKVLPKLENGELTWIGQGGKTVDVQQIKERFKALDISIDSKRLDKVNNKRNQLEHYFDSESSVDAIKEIIVNSFYLIRDFTEEVLKESTAELLGVNCYSSFIKVSDFYEDELLRCKKSLNSAEIISSEYLKNAIVTFNCEDCYSPLLMFHNGVFQCKSCLKDYEKEVLIETALRQADYVTAYESKGYDQDIIDCPCCNKNTYIIDDNACCLCGESLSNECSICGDMIMPEELTDSGMCGYCQHKMNKLERE